MTLSDIMTPEQISMVRQVSQLYNVPEELLAAIGQHETHWGQLGAGKQGWYLGYGYYPGSTVAEQYKGLLPQLQGASSQIANFFRNKSLTWENWQDFARQSWRPGDPRAWAESTWTIYQQLREETAQAKPGMSIGPAPTTSQTRTGVPAVKPVVLAGGTIILALALVAGIGLMVVGGMKDA